MNRKNKIYNLLEELTKTLLKNNFCSSSTMGFDAMYISGIINISRENVSRELNNLVKENKVIKISGKPVVYLRKDCIENTLHIILDKCIFANIEEFKKFLNINEKPHDQIKTNIADKPKNVDNYFNESLFNTIIGADGSLKNQIKQATAAILYPPNGLHTLLIGPTGVGKTMFAEIMYKYAIQIGKLKKDAPYVIFNCADYAGNPQLLLSCLFGYIKGAFTGSDKNQKGLIDAADGGILFLDEVHRLPPEGQEMLFSLIDRGKFRRLGETDNINKANVLIIAATTESPDKAILSTFLRRIPCVINLPGLSERPTKERMELICKFFTEESKKIKLPIIVSTEVLKFFLVYDCGGNIGQLKNDIQLICANAFVEYITEKESKIYIKLSQLSDKFEEGIFTLGKKRKEIIEDFDLNNIKDLTFDGFNSDFDDSIEKILIHDEYETEQDFYESLLDNTKKYFEEGVSIQNIKKNINKQIAEQFKHVHFKMQNKDIKDKIALFKIVSPEIFEIVSDVLLKASKDFNVNKQIIYSLSLHIETLIERIKSGTQLYDSGYNNSFLSENSTNSNIEYKISKEIANRLEEKLKIKIPKTEIAFIEMFLYALKVKNEEDYIGVLVLAHGYSTAASMVDVANNLLGIDHAKAIDMPLEESVNVTLNKAIDMVKKIDKGKGVLILADMGSLTTFSEIITEKTGIPTKAIKMVSTPVVIEATRKSMLTNMNLDLLVQEVNNMSIYIGEGIKVENDESIYSENKEIKADLRIFSNEEKFIDLIEKILVFLNPRKAYMILKETYIKILVDLKEKPNDALEIKFIFHSICMIERVIRNETLSYNNLTNIKETKRSLFNIIKNDFETVENVFNITIPDNEFAYIVEIIDDCR